MMNVSCIDQGMGVIRGGVLTDTYSSLYSIPKTHQDEKKTNSLPHQQLPEGDDVCGGGVVPVVVVHNDAVLTATDAKT